MARSSVDWALEYRRKGREVRILLNGQEMGRIECPEMSIMTETELEEYNERLIRTTLEMAADSLRTKARLFKSLHGETMSLGQHYWCDGVDASADEIDPRVEETGA